MLAGAGSVHGERAVDQPFQKTMGTPDLVGVALVDQQQHMKIAVADMTDDRRDQSALVQVALRLGDAFGEPGDRHADVGRERADAGADADRRPIGVVPRLPQSAAILGLGRPIEWAAAKLARDLAEALRLFGDARLAAVKFDEQHRRFRQAQFGIGVAGFDLQRVQKLDPRDRNAGLDGENRRIARRLDAGERTHARRDRLGNAGQPQGQFGDDAERAFGADHQPGQIVAGRGFLGAVPGRYHFAIGEHGFERQHIVLHGAVAHRIGARRAGRRHAAERRVGAGIDRKEHAGIA